MRKDFKDPHLETPASNFFKQCIAESMKVPASIWKTRCGNRKNEEEAMVPSIQSSGTTLRKATYL